MSHPGFASLGLIFGQWDERRTEKGDYQARVLPPLWGPIEQDVQGLPISVLKELLDTFCVFLNNDD